IDVLNARYAKDYHHPQDVQTLRSDLLDSGIDGNALRDPWDGRCRAEFETIERFDITRFVSAGPDKHFGTGDDLVCAAVERAHFQPVHDAMLQVLQKLPAFPATESAARAALLAANIDPDRQHDPWGTDHHSEFHTRRERGVLAFRSAGPDHTFGT